MHESGDRGQSKHEQRDINLGTVGLFLAGLAVLMAGSALFLWFLFGELAEQRRAETPPPPPLAGARAELPPEPRLQQQPTQNLEEMRRAEEEKLTTYGWVDRETGRVRLPIERAIELVAERGLPVREKEEQRK